MNRYWYLMLLFGLFSCQAQPKNDQKSKQIRPGAYEMSEYIPLVQDKKTGLFVNHTSLIGETHLTDTLLSQGINITKVFTPEHGFKGNMSDGELIEGQKTNKPFELISLYGSSKKPTAEQLDEVDVLIIDIQDVGVRFYTYASTMTYLMEACAKNDIPVIILDRPNPNGSYVDGPVLKEEFSSFVGLHPIPLVHGLTLGEFALMINGEGWLEDGIKCDLRVIKVKNWDHGKAYSLPVNPSPNLPNDLAIALYPSLALFEGTIVSVGRGTDFPFQVIGHPKYGLGSYVFTPQPNQGSKYPPLEGEVCYGQNLSGSSIPYEFTLSYLIGYYQVLKGKTEKPFFNSYFTKLAGTDELQKQIEAGMSEEEIRMSWQDDLEEFNQLRNKYLLYP